MFGASRDQLIGQSFRILYPSADEFERIGERIAPILNAHGHYSDERIMRRVGGRFAGQTFWCHVTSASALARSSSAPTRSASAAAAAPRRRGRAGR